MQENIVEIIRELMKTQGVSIRQISAKIAQEQGGSALGYTHQINRILNDPSYEPSFSTVQKILAALKVSIWQSSPQNDIKTIETRLDRLSDEILEIKQTLVQLSDAIHAQSKSE